MRISLRPALRYSPFSSLLHPALHAAVGTAAGTPLSGDDVLRVWVRSEERVDRGHGEGQPVCVGHRVVVRVVATDAIERGRQRDACMREKVRRAAIFHAVQYHCGLRFHEPQCCYSIFI